MYYCIIWAFFESRTTELHVFDLNHLLYQYLTDTGELDRILILDTAKSLHTETRLKSQI